MGITRRTFLAGGLVIAGLPLVEASMPLKAEPLYGLWTAEAKAKDAAASTGIRLSEKLFTVRSSVMRDATPPQWATPTYRRCIQWWLDDLTAADWFQGIDWLVTEIESVANAFESREIYTVWEEPLRPESSCAKDWWCAVPQLFDVDCDVVDSLVADASVFKLPCGWMLRIGVDFCVSNINGKSYDPFWELPQRSLGRLYRFPGGGVTIFRAPTISES